MTGWKSKLASISSMLGGLALIIKDIADGSFEHFAEGWSMIVFGIGIWGVAHKIEKTGT